MGLAGIQKIRRKGVCVRHTLEQDDPRSFRREAAFSPWGYILSLHPESDQVSVSRESVSARKGSSTIH